MNKRITPRKILDAVKLVKKHGMATRSSFFFGYPGEGMVDILKTFLLMWRAGLKGWEITFGNHPILYPGTTLFDNISETGYLPSDFSWAGETELPCYKDVPIYLPPHDGTRQLMIKALWKMKKAV